VVMDVDSRAFIPKLMEVPRDRLTPLTGHESGLRPEVAPRDLHIRTVWSPTSHLADLQLVHDPCAKI
jgi:hypothetical protein